jgi:carboxyl-terminal processing protease
MKPSLPHAVIASLLLTANSFVYAIAESEPTAAQSNTLKAMIDELEDSHYVDRRYDDSMSQAHLEAYLDRLDPSRLFLTAADITEFSKWQTFLDDLGKDGDLDPAFHIYNTYAAQAEARLTQVIEELPDLVANFNYDVDEYTEADPTERAWASDDEALTERWRKRLKSQALSLKLADKPADEIAPTLVKRYENQLMRLGQNNQQDVFAVYANALTTQFDPHTSYFSPRRAENFDIDMSLSFEGIGAVLQNEDEYVKVVRIVPAGPADKQSDLKPSELIVGVGQGDSGALTDVIGWRLDDVVDMIRGPRDTTVRLEVIPSASRSDERRLLTITRNQVKLEEQAAQKKVIEINDVQGNPRKIGIIDIPAFYLDFDAYRRGDPEFKSTTRDVARLIHELNQESIDGLVIDLRNNGGGSLREANELTGLFIEYGPTVQIRSASSRVYRDGKRRRGPYYDGPVAVMINRLSASASEIFAGALQDYGRAVIVGDRSFGKGTVQTLLELPEGQLKVTESKFYRISGDSTQHRGVVPDISFPSLLQHDEIGESAYDNALDWDRIAPIRYRDYGAVSSILPILAKRHSERAMDNPDFQYILDQQVLAEDIRSEELVSLNETERRVEREQQEADYLAIENTRRLAKGESLLSSLDELLDEEPSDAIEVTENAVTDSSVLQESAAGAVDDGDEADDSDDPDALAVETARILADAINLRSPAVVQRGNP